MQGEDGSAGGSSRAGSDASGPSVRTASVCEQRDSAEPVNGWRHHRRVRTPVFHQAQITECGVAALAIILAHFGRWVTMEELREATGVSRDGTNAADLARAACRYGLKAVAVRTEPEDLAALGLPLIAHLDFIHFVVVERIGKRSVQVNDPESGRHQIPREKFAERFTGIALVFERTAEFQPGGARRHLCASLWRAAGSGTHALAIAVIGALVMLPTVLFALLLARLVDRLPSHSSAAPLLAGLTAAALARLALSWALEVGLVRLERAVSSRTAELLRRMLTLPFRFFTYRLPSDLQSLVLRGQVDAGRTVGGPSPALERGVRQGSPPIRAHHRLSPA